MPTPIARPHTMLVAHPSADLYGSDRVLLESVAGMVAEGWRVVVTLPAAGPLVAELLARGAEVELCAAPVLRRSALRPVGLVRLAGELAGSIPRSVRLIVGTRADGIYVNTITIPSWLLLGRLLGRSVTAHVHEAEESTPAVIRWLMSLPLVFAHRIIVNSAFTLQVLTGTNHLLRRRSTVVYNAVPAPEVTTPARAVLDAPVRLLFVGRLSPRKGPQVAVAAAAHLRNRGVEVQLDLLGAVVAGAESFEDELAAAVADAGLSEQVSFLGFDADVWSHLAASDVVLVPSVMEESFGNTAVEATLAGRPSVVSATSGLIEASAGYVSAQSVPPDRPDLVADAVQHVIEDWERYRAGAVTDAALARQRHSVRRYQQDVVRVLLS